MAPTQAVHDAYANLYLMLLITSQTRLIIVTRKSMHHGGQVSVSISLCTRGVCQANSNGSQGMDAD